MVMSPNVIWREPSDSDMMELLAMHMSHLCSARVGSRVPPVTILNMRLPMLVTFRVSSPMRAPMS